MIDSYSRNDNFLVLTLEISILSLLFGTFLNY